MVHENAADNPGGRTKEVGAVLPVHLFLIDKTDVDVIDQRRGLKGMAGIFFAQVPPGQPAKFLIHDGHQTIERTPIAVIPR